MAHAITGHTILNGSRNLIVQFNIKSDGASGQYANFELLDLADYTGEDGKASNDFSVKKIFVNTSVGAGVELKFGDVGGDHKTFFLSPINTANGFEYFTEYPGGLPQLLANPENKIRLTSLGLDAAGDWITIVLWLKKRYSSTGS